MELSIVLSLSLILMSFTLENWLLLMYSSDKSSWSFKRLSIMSQQSFTIKRSEKNLFFLFWFMFAEYCLFSPEFLLQTRRYQFFGIDSSTFDEFRPWFSSSLNNDETLTPAAFTFTFTIFTFAFIVLSCFINFIFSRELLLLSLIFRIDCF